MQMIKILKKIKSFWSTNHLHNVFVTIKRKNTINQEPDYIVEWALESDAIWEEMEFKRQISNLFRNKYVEIAKKANIKSKNGQYFLIKLEHVQQAYDEMLRKINQDYNNYQI